MESIYSLLMFYWELYMIFIIIVDCAIFKPFYFTKPEPHN